MTTTEAPTNGGTAERSTSRRSWADSRIVAGVALAITWLLLLPTEGKVASSGVDASWVAGLQMGAQEQLQQGTEVVYTYGPLGFLTTNVYVYSRPWLLATVAVWVVAAAIPLIVFWLLRSVLPAGLAGLVTAVILPFTVLYTQIFLPAVWGLALSLLGLGLVVRGRTVPRWAVAGFGVLTACMLLVSPVAATGSGIALLTASLLPLTGPGDRRPLLTAAGTFAGSFVIGFFAFWFLAGQGLGNLGDWARYTASTVSGYGAAMQTSASPWHVVELLAALGLVAFTIAAVWRRSADVPKIRRLGALVLYVLLAYLAYKHGFVRQDAGHIFGFFEFATLAPLAFLPWIRLRAGSLAVGSGLVVLAFLYLVSAPTFQGWDTVDAGWESIRRRYAPSDHIDALTATVELATSADKRSSTARQGMSSVVKTAKFPVELVSSFEGKTVHVSPWDASLEYGLQGTTWDPAPVFQDYVAYTSALDDLNADWFAGPDAADIVLRRPGFAIDNRLPRWEPPSATLSMLCHYRPDGEPLKGWMTLRRLDSSRCGDLEAIGSETTSMGTTFTPPAAEPGSILVARFSGIADGPLDRLVTTAFKGPDVRVDLPDHPGLRFLPGTQGSWHILSAPGCTSSTLDGGPPIDASSIRFTNRGGPGSWLADALSSSTIEVEYASIPFTC